MSEVEEKQVDTEVKAESSSAEEVDVERAVNLLAQGKRNLLCGEVQQSVNQLQEAAELLGKKYGQTATECGEAYLCYGRALLELSRMENAVLGNALQGVEPDDDDEEDDKSQDSGDKDEEKPSEEEKERISEMILDAMLEKEESKETAKVDETGDAATEGSKEAGETTQETKEEGKEEGRDNGEEKEGDKKDEKEAGDQEETNAEVKDGEKEGEAEMEEEEEEVQEEDLNTEEEEDATAPVGEEGKEEDEVSSLQLAWEILELAKVIFKRNETTEGKLKLAEALLKLGEVGMETELYDQALGDLTECLELQKSFLEGSDRRLAETYYQIGIAYHCSCKYDEALEALRAAVDVLKLRLEKNHELIKSSEPKDFPGPEDPVFLAQKEIIELEAVITDMSSKIEDVLEEKRSPVDVKDAVKDAVSGLAENAVLPGTSDAPATDISHLVRKKRKPEDAVASPNKDEDTKKPKLETEVDEKENGNTMDTTEQKPEEIKAEEEKNGSAENKEQEAMDITNLTNGNQAEPVANGHENGCTAIEKEDSSAVVKDDPIAMKKALERGAGDADTLQA